MLILWNSDAQIKTDDDDDDDEGEAESCQSEYIKLFECFLDILIKIILHIVPLNSLQYIVYLNKRSCFNTILFCFFSPSL